MTMIGKLLPVRTAALRCNSAKRAMRCGNGAAHDNGYRRWVAVPHSGGVTGSERVGPKHQGRNSRGLFCRNRRVLGTKQCLRGGRYRKDCPGSEGSKRAGGAGGVVCRERPEVHADRPGSRATVAVVACWTDGGGACRDPDRDAAPQG